MQPAFSLLSGCGISGSLVAKVLRQGGPVTTRHGHLLLGVTKSPFRAPTEQQALVHKLLKGPITVAPVVGQICTINLSLVYMKVAQFLLTLVWTLRGRPSMTPENLGKPCADLVTL